MDPITKLLAIEEIKFLKARYFRFVDTHDWEGLRNLFSDDATLEFRESMEGSCSIDDFMPKLADMLAGVTSVHHGHMPEIEIHSADSASSIWAMNDLLLFSDQQSAFGNVAMIRGCGHYHETYVRQDRGWLIRTLRLTRLRLEKVLKPQTVA